MAITKIHSIRRTLGYSVRYITNTDKTEGESYISCFGCSRETLASEFAMTRSLADKKSPILAQHLIQSFAKDEIEPSVAHQIGKELADRFTEGRHEYIIATHTDRGHIHNHIIFNHVDFIDHKCFHSDAKKLRLLRAINDEICEAYGLSVIRSPRSKGKTYYKWAMDKLGRSYSNRPGTKTGTGISIDKTSGTTVKKPAYIRIWKYDQSLGLIENTGNYLLFVQSEYTKQRLAIQDAKKVAATYNLLKERGIDSLDSLNEVLRESKANLKEARETVRQTENKIAEINDTLKYAERISKYRPIYSKYVKGGKTKAYYEAHRTELMLYESAKKTLEQKGMRGESIRLSVLKKEHSALEDKRLDASASLDSLRSDYNDLLTAKRNVEAIIHEGQYLESDKTRPQQIE